MTELKDQLSLLGRKTEYRQNYAPEVLEAFDNKHPGNDYWVRFNCPEFTSLCPITGQPDFAEIRICYIPDVKMVERHLHLSVCQLRTSRHEVRADGRASFDEP